MMITWTLGGFGMAPAGEVVEARRAALGRNARRLRQTQGLSQERLARQLGISAATLSAIENGLSGMSSTRAWQLADILSVPVADLFTVQHFPDTAASPGTRTGLSAWRHFAPLHLDAALSGALSAFVEFGYHGASMRTVAARAGLSVPGLYHHYPGKQDLLVALLDLTMTDLRARSEAAGTEATSSTGRFTCLVECLALFHTHRRELAFLGASEMRSLEPEARRRVAGLRSDVQRMVDTEVNLAVREGAFLTPRPKQAARAVVTMCTALAQWFRRDGPASAEQVAAQYVDFALDVVRAVSEPSD